MEEINRISIIGGPGTGKTTLAINLGNELKLPIYHMDQIAHLPNWIKRTKEERDKIILEKINEKKKVIDGTYKGTLESRIKKSDLVIFLNYSTLSKISGIIKRYIKGRGKEKRELPGCKEKISLEFLKYTFTWNIKQRKKIEDILNKNNKKDILIFKSRKELNNWYEEKFNKKIEIN